MKNQYTLLTRMQILLATIFVVSSMTTLSGQTVSSFEALSLDPESYWYGSDNSGGFTNGNAKFFTKYTPAWGSSTGFYYSNKTDVTTAGWSNQYSAFTGGGYNGSSNYAVAYDGPIGIKLQGEDAGKKVNGFFISNTTFTALSMKNGDQFAKKFGGVSGNDPDWLKLTIKGYLNNAATPNEVEFYLADFRFENNAQDYILDTWKWVDLNGLGDVDSLSFSFASSDMTDIWINTPTYFAMDNFNDPLYAPAAGIDGTDAINKTDAAFVSWATGCNIVRGLKNIATGGPNDTTTIGTFASALGIAGTAGVVSLGDGGSATLTFPYPIENGNGADFAVFENGFSGGENLTYMELGFVEVSSDGERFVRFPAVSLSSNTTQVGSFEYIDARKIHNLAGKYVSNYGTPFDLEDVKDSAGLDVTRISHVRIVDAVGSIDPEYATYDSQGNPVNDPWSTDFGSGGFDLDAVGVIHQNITEGIIAATTTSALSVFPNPAQSNQEVSIHLNSISEETLLQVFNVAGTLVMSESLSDNQTNISTQGLESGIYMIKMSNSVGTFVEKLVVR